MPKKEKVINKEIVDIINRNIIERRKGIQKTTAFEKVFPNSSKNNK